jgi:hypothetical protein
MHCHSQSRYYYFHRLHILQDGTPTKIKEYKLISATPYYPKREKWKYINLNPEAPAIKALIKLHKENKPI